MIEQTGSTYLSSEYLKAFIVATAKVGKTVGIVSQALGVFPGQKYGGLVDAPEHLHVITLDSNAAGGIQTFLTETCGASKEALGFRIYNMQEDVRQVASTKGDWNMQLYNTLMSAHGTIKQRVKREGGVHVVVVSSLTTLFGGLKRALAGDPAGKKGGGMDMAKWETLGQQVTEIRNLFQQDEWHCIWEGHIMQVPVNTQSKGDDQEMKEAVQLQGSAGRDFPNNVEQIFRMKRMFGERAGNSRADRIYLDTQADLQGIIGGRCFNELLDAKEFDLALTAHKLGTKIGRWGAQKKKKKAVSADS